MLKLCTKVVSMHEIARVFKLDEDIVLTLIEDTIERCDDEEFIKKNFIKNFYVTVGPGPKDNYMLTKNALCLLATMFTESDIPTFMMLLAYFDD